MLGGGGDSPPTNQSTKRKKRRKRKESIGVEWEKPKREEAVRGEKQN